MGNVTLSIEVSEESLVRAVGLSGVKDPSLKAVVKAFTGKVIKFEKQHIPLRDNMIITILRGGKGVLDQLAVKKGKTK